jgi:hypothetical protein
VVDLHERGDVPLLQTLDHVELPQRLGAVEGSREHALDLLGELAAPAGGRQGRPPQVEAEVERHVVHPDGQPEPEGHRLHLLPQARREMQARGEHARDVLEPHAPARA